MTRDPIIEDLHRLREKIGRAHGFDARRIADTLRRHEEESRRAIIRELPRRRARQRKAS
jgi:hypothetical protein